MYISSTKVPFRPKLRPHLPKEVSSEGRTAADMAKACGDYIADVKAGRTPSVDPYSSELSSAGKVKLSGELRDLANNAQADFSAQTETTGGALRLTQLEGSLQALQTEMNHQISQTNGDIETLKSGYRKQVAKTIGWMAGTAGALIVGGILPNPLSVLGVGVMATCTIRSIGKSRAAQKNLAQQMPELKQNLEASKEVLAQTVSYGPAVAAWNSALGGTAGQTLAA
ncbi:MAG: hypothetical protein KC800_08060 [Candidatus Eremiobacteraeota bacterium]|nr:hypothetical protein [Candidatus Eremiobacteraeota bacterium]